MDALYNLKDMLCEQLEVYGEKGEISNSILERVDTLAHAVKNLDKVIECRESEDYGMDDWSRRSHSRNAYRGMNSMRRSRMSGRSRRSYSGNGDLAEQLYSMMDEVDDDQTKQEIERLAAKMDKK